MSIIPLHLQRRFEQRWASRFARPAASIAPKNVETKSTPLAGCGVGQEPKQQAREIDDGHIDDGHNVTLHRLNGAAEIG
jgi:hypothetical protein